jgi:predicted GNAT family acetyltransferase
MVRRWQPELLLFDPLYKAELLMHRLLPSWFLQPRWRRIYEMPVTKEPPHKADAVDFRWASAADTHLLESYHGEQLTTARLSYGHRAAILVKNDKLIGVAWFATRSYYDVDTQTRVTLSFDEAWIYGVWIHRRYRRRGLYADLLRHAGVELRRRGIRQLLFAIDAFNIRSRRLHQRLLAKPIGHLYGVRLAFFNAYRFHRELVPRG